MWAAAALLSTAPAGSQSGTQVRNNQRQNKKGEHLDLLLAEGEVLVGAEAPYF